MTDQPDFERNQMQIRNALYGAANAANDAAGEEAEAAAKFNNFSHIVGDGVVNINRDMDIARRSFDVNHHTAEEKGRETQARLDKARDQLEGVMTSRVGNAVIARLEADKAAVQAIYQEMRGSVVLFGDLVHALHALRRALEAKKQQSDEAVQQAAGLSADLLDAAAKVQYQADTFK